jgi:hypothetical protein
MICSPSWVRRVMTLLLTATAVGCYRRAWLDGEPPIADLRFEASATVIGAGNDSIALSIVAHNPTTSPRFVTRSGCAGAALRIYDVERGGRLRWDSQEWSRAQAALAAKADSAIWPLGKDTSRVLTGCLASLVTLELPPGKSVELASLAVPIAAVLGDSLPSDRYRLTARAPGAPWRAGERPAGEIQLRLPD